jgi:hypothetical protein
MRSLLFLPFIFMVGCGPTVGDPCTTERDCGSGICLNRDFTPGGYCSRLCNGDAPDCPQGSICVANANGRGAAACLRSCQSGSDCRSGYLCRSEKQSVVKVCVGPEGL